MSAALDSMRSLLGWRNGAPNFADRDSDTSCAIAEAILSRLGIAHDVRHAGQTAGRLLEEIVEAYLAEELPSVMHGRPISVARKPPITDFEQYEHLATLASLLEDDQTRVLRASIGTDYLIKPDVTVGVYRSHGHPPPVLHAAVPCKWTLRSDRAQNVRHEAVMMIRHRRGRLPHIAPVTAEPLPSRLASLARGTAEVDCVYHVCLEDLASACHEVGNQLQIDVLDELVDNRRLRDLAELPETLAT